MGNNNTNLAEAQGAETKEVKRKPSAQGSFTSILNGLNNLKELDLMDEKIIIEIKEKVQDAVYKWMENKFK